MFARLDETPDAEGQIMDYATSKPRFEAWSDGMAKASGGKNLGNVRAMHGARVAGLVREITFDDMAKAIGFQIMVTNADEWENCALGVYTGISPGGKMVKFAGSKRFTALPVELSLVDKPSNPNATFTMMKADGMEETRHFAPAADIEAVVEDMAKAAGATALAAVYAALPVSTVVRMFGTDADRAPEAPMLKRMADAGARRGWVADGAALPDGSFPVATADDVPAAVLAVSRAADPVAAQAHVTTRAQALGAADKLPPGWEGAVAPMKKGMDQVACLSRILDNLGWLAGDITGEAAKEGDGSTIPAQLCAWMRTGVGILTAMAGEESAEMVASLQTQVNLLPLLEAAEGGTDDDAADPMTKGAAWPRLLAITTELADVREEMAKFAGAAAAATRERDAALARVQTLEALPAAGVPALRAVPKERDGRDALADALKPATAPTAVGPGFEGAREAMRLALFPTHNN